MIRVLVVDDDFMVARLHGTLTERVPGFTVAGVAHNGTDACRLVRELQPDLVLLDIYLPDVPGLEVLRELRGGAAPEEGPDVLVVTAARDAETVRGAQRGGAVQYIIKPFEGRLLQERLRRYADRRAELAALNAPEQGDVDRLFGGADRTDETAPTYPPAHASMTTRRGETDTTVKRQGMPASSAGHPLRAAPGAGRGPAALPKGLTVQTAALIRETLDAAPQEAGLSASECAARSGLSRVSSRRYLEHFVATGTAHVTLRYGTTGRPERRYHRTDAPTGRPSGPA